VIAAVTALSFGIALALFFIGQRDRRQADEDRLRTQARKVWIWVIEYYGQEREDSYRITRADYRIENSSPDPIMNCMVGVGTIRSLYRNPKEEPDFRTIMPGKREEDSFTGDIFPRKELRLKWRGPLISLVFTDAAGLRWGRDSEGNLELLPRPGRSPR
jgi:hypothetical protein